MIDIFILLILIPIAIAISAVTYSFVLTRPDMIFNGWYNRLDIFFETDKRASEGKSAHWLFKILLYCEKCISGQAAFWIFLYFKWQNYFFNFSLQIVLQHIFFTLFSIFLAAIIKHIYNKHIEK